MMLLNCVSHCTDFSIIVDSEGDFTKNFNAVIAGSKQYKAQTLLLH